MILKTLKDLEIPIGSYTGCESGNTLVIDKVDIRREAIKWIKHNQACIRYYMSIMPTSDNQSTLILIEEHRAIISWIRNFFDITEEEMR
jgi:hypothetical protein